VAVIVCETTVGCAVCVCCWLFFEKFCETALDEKDQKGTSTIDSLYIASK